MPERLSRYCKSAYRRFLSFRGTPREIALGFALGLFVGMSPYMMCHTVTAVFLASLFRCSKFSAAAGVFITNPVTAPFFYRGTYIVGTWVITPRTTAGLPREFSPDALLQLLGGAPELLRILTVGGIITGIPIAVIGYCGAYYAALKYRKKSRPVRLP